MLLVREIQDEGRWTLPGGWADINDATKAVSSGPVLIALCGLGQSRLRGDVAEEQKIKQILTPEHLLRLLLAGFGEPARRYAERLREYANNVAILRYGFRFHRSEVTEHTVRDTIEAVIGRTRREAETSEQLSAVIHGVDDAWEVCLLKFTIDLIERSSGGNIGDFRRRGLL